MDLLYQLSFEEGRGDVTTEQVKGKQLNINYVFNHAKYKNKSDPQWIQSDFENYSVIFDGYSTFITDDPIDIKGSFTVSALVAPRGFEACHEEVTTTIIDQLDKERNEGFALSLYRFGEIQFEIGLGKTISLLRTETSIPLYEYSLITAVYDAFEKGMKIYLNNELVSEATIEGTYKNSKCTLSIGRNNYPFKMGPFSGGMFAGAIHHIKIYEGILTWKGISERYHQMVHQLQISYEQMGLNEKILLEDQHRPQYHVMPPQHWMNEPHAPFYFNGKYHLFYQRNGNGPYFSNLHWGHWTSEDLVYWENERPALLPTKGDLSPSGIWSGSATVGPEGVPILFYTAANLEKFYSQGVALARPKDLNDPKLQDWILESHLAIEQTEEQGIPSQFRDPFVWKSDHLQMWYLIIGGGTESYGPNAWIYSSTDCKRWQFNGSFFSVDAKKHPCLGTNWELPVFLPVYDEKGNKKYIFIFMSYFMDGQEVADTYYYLGNFDEVNKKFVPDQEEPQLLDYGKFKFSGPSGFVDPNTNKTIVFSILQGDRSAQEEYDAGWAHNAGLPIELYLKNNELRLKPLETLKKLRRVELINKKNQPLGVINEILKDVKEKMIELVIEFEETYEDIGLQLKEDPEGLEFTKLIYHPREALIALDRRYSRFGHFGDIQSGSLKLNKGLCVHVFIDHSAVECYLNNQKMISSRIYTVKPDSDLISLIGNDNVLIKRMKAYSLNPIWR